MVMLPEPSSSVLLDEATALVERCTEKIVAVALWSNMLAPFVDPPPSPISRL